VSCSVSVSLSLTFGADHRSPRRCRGDSFYREIRLTTERISANPVGVTSSRLMVDHQTTTTRQLSFPVDVTSPDVARAIPIRV
jgi:hypothetical protein